jgi:hypothetical protein
MILKDNQGKDRIKFSDIVRLNKEEPVFVKMKVRISTETMVSEENLDIERSNLEGLTRNLKDLCEYKIRKFFFQNIDETIEIVFSINDIGAIAVEGKMYDESYMNSINFSFQTDLNGIATFSKEISQEIEKCK